MNSPASPPTKRSPIRTVLRRCVSFLGGGEPAVLIVSFLFLATGFAFIQIADAVEDGETSHFDDWAIRALRNPVNPAISIGPEWFNEMMRDTTALGGYGCLIFFTAAVAGYLHLDRKKHLAQVLVVSVVSGYLLSTLLKAMFQRPRPDIVPHLSYVASTSFPSGHSMNAAVVYLTLGTLLAASVERTSLKIYVISMALFLTIAVGFSRVYLGVHYPTDVAAGWMAGIAWALLCWLVARFLQRRGQVESPVHLPDEGQEPPLSL